MPKPTKKKTTKKKVAKKKATKKSPRKKGSSLLDARAAREKLARTMKRTKSEIPDWFDENPEAAKFVELWMDMATAGESDWSIKRVVQELKDEHGFKWHPENKGVRDHFRRRYGERYSVAVDAAAETRRTRRAIAEGDEDE